MRETTTHRGRLHLTTLVVWLMRSIFALITIGVPTLYYEISQEYESGSVDSEAKMNAHLISELIVVSPNWLSIKHPELQRFVETDQLEDGDDDRENRRIISVSGNLVIGPKNLIQLKWPTKVSRAPIRPDGYTVGFFEVERSISDAVQHTAILAFILFACSMITDVMLRRFVFIRLKATEMEVAWKASFDTLTGLPNRASVINELQKRLQRSSQIKVAVLFIDLDRFKSVNDTYGHAMGDTVLQAATHEIRKCLHSGSYIGRLAGDEFLIILDLDVDDAAVKRVSESIISAFAHAPLVAGIDIAFGATIGVAIGPTHGTDAEALIQKADTAMYVAKTKGRGTWLLYTHEMTAKVDRETQIRGRMQQALERYEFEVYYQPIIDLSTGGVIGAEALLRWNDKQNRIMVSPAEFIPELESSGLIIAVGQWVLETVCRQVADCEDLPSDFYISINVSARQLMMPGFINGLRNIVSESGIAANAIMVELTESMLIDDGMGCDRLKELKELGVRLAIDDFGTGYSSLGRIADFPFDVIKIDRKFINNLTPDRHWLPIVLSMLILAKGLDMVVIAEGIETVEQKNILLSVGCNTGQGFLFARPMPFNRFRDYCWPVPAKQRNYDPVVVAQLS